MRTILVIGIGTGNPDHVTVQAIKALNRADVVLLPRKGEEKGDLAELRREICRLHLASAATRIVEFDLPVRDEAEPSYARRVADWHGEIARRYRALIEAECGPEGTVALLVWGDPSLYDSSLRILDRLEEGGLAFRREIVPGITSLQALCAAHGVPLNEVGGKVTLMPARRLREEGTDGTTAVFLDGGTAFDTLPGGEWEIVWGAYLGSPDELLIAGPLEEAGEKIARARAEARAKKGWIMDVYLLRPRKG